MKKITYLTTNPLKVEEAKLILSLYDIEVEILDVDFEILEIQAKNCADVAKFSAKYAAEKLGIPVLKSDSGLYVDALGGLPGPYNAYFANQIGIDKFLKLLKNEKNRSARIEHCFAYCEPGSEPIVFVGGSTGTISRESRGVLGAWHDKFYIPDGENKTLSELRSIDHVYESKFYGNALRDFAKWYLKHEKVKITNSKKDKKRIAI